MSFIVQRAIRMGSIGPSSVVRMPVGKKAIWPARISFRFDDDEESSERALGMRKGLDQP